MLNHSDEDDAAVVSRVGEAVWNMLGRWPKGVRRPIELAIYPKSMSPADIAGDGSKVSWGATRQLEEEKGTRKKRRQKSAR